MDEPNNRERRATMERLLQNNAKRVKPEPREQQPASPAPADDGGEGNAPD